MSTEFIKDKEYKVSIKDMKHSLYIIYLMLCVGCLCINGSGKILEHNFIDFCILVYFGNWNENEIYANWKVKIVKKYQLQFSIFSLF